MAKKITSPYKNQNLSDLKNERWESIPGLDGYFEVSNFGRIKRLSREVIRQGLKGGVYILPEKIIAPRVMETPNKLVKDHTYQLAAHLSLNNTRYHFPIRRLVYYCFVEQFDMDESGISISSKNGKGLDIRPSNLVLLDSSSRMKGVYHKGRMISSFKGANNRSGTIASLKFTQKQVSQYDLQGNLIETYPSIMEASRQTGTPHSLIGHVLAQRQNKTRKYYFAYGKKKKFDYKSLLNKKALDRKEKRGTKVEQYDLSGRLIATYLTLLDAGKALNKSYTGISANIRGIIKVAYGYVWKRAK